MTLRSLEEHELHLQRIIEQMSRIMKSACVPENTMIKRDQKWGSRSIHFIVRLDEFSPGKFEQMIPELKRIYEEYKTVRTSERSLLNKIGKSRRLLPDITGDL